MTDRLTQIARELRARQTPEERKLWVRLRDRRLNGLKFRRQAPCGNFVADFLCEEAKLVVELDGSQHGEAANIKKDIQRSLQLNNLGYGVFRVWNADINTNIEGVLDGLLAVATSRLCPSSAPSGHALPMTEGSELSSPGTEEDVARLQVRDLTPRSAEPRSPSSGLWPPSPLGEKDTNATSE